MADFSAFTLITAFIGGVLMFLAPCTLPLIPALLGSLLPGDDRASRKYTGRIILRTISFSLGFTIIFVLFGVITGFFGSKLDFYKQAASQIGGLIIIVFGLSVLGVFNRSFLNRSKQLRMSFVRPDHPLAPPLLGALFALGWTPCAGPILASILLLASNTATAFQGGVLLATFSLGLFVPLIIVGSMYATTVTFFNFYERYRILLNRISGVFLIVLGVLLTFGKLIIVTSWGFALYSFFGYVPACTFF